MSNNFDADVVPVTDSLYADLDERYGGFAGHSLIACHTFDSDWPTWEVHPKGDELVLLLEGAAELVLASAGGDKHVNLSKSGQFVIVPRGVWHTARVRESARMLFVTPGEGTENREQPERADDG